MTDKERKRIETFCRDLARTYAAHGCEGTGWVRIRGMDVGYDFQVMPGRGVAIFKADSIPGDEELFMVEVDTPPPPF